MSNLEVSRPCKDLLELTFPDATTHRGCFVFVRQEDNKIMIPLCKFIVENGRCPKGRTVEAKNF